MKYAFLFSGHFISPHSGVRFQALMWKEGLEKLGQHVDLVDNWSGVFMEDYDALIVFDFAPGVRWFWKGLHSKNKNLIVAPIIDPHTPDFIFKFFLKYWGCQKFLGLSSRYHDMWLARKYPILWLVRSEQESHYTNYCLEIPQEKIVKVPLHFRVPKAKKIPSKENFCLHVSSLYPKNKNLPSLVAAAKKFRFPLKLAGYIKGEEQERWLKNLIEGAENIEYIGRLSELELVDMYGKAKVFALPSLVEGVGMVALEAAAYGCEIVLTNVGAPKEYFDGRAILVNPKSVDEIGQGIMRALKEGYSQPELKLYIEQNYSEEVCMKLLHENICKAIGYKG